MKLTLAIGLALQTLINLSFSLKPSPRVPFSLPRVYSRHHPQQRLLTLWCLTLARRRVASSRRSLTHHTL